MLDNPFAPYNLTVGDGTPFAATLKFEHDAELGEWSSLIVFADNRLNRAEEARGIRPKFYRGWIGPSASNIAVESRAERYWRDLCTLIQTGVSIQPVAVDAPQKDVILAKLIELRGIWAEGQQSSSSDRAIGDIDDKIAELLTKP